MGLSEVQSDIAVRLLVAAGVGMIIGIEREIREQAAGMRTHMLVATGACLFTIVSVFGFEGLLDGAVDPSLGHDPARVASNVVTGVGFLGAGAILREGRSVRGLTTAASLWVVAAIGMAVGLGMYWAASVAAAVTVLSLAGLRFFRRRLRER